MKIIKNSIPNIISALKILILLLLLVLIFAAWFRVEHYAEVLKTRDLINTFSGAGIIIVLTTLVLMIQTRVQARESKKQEVFKQKIKLYNDIIQASESIREDGTLDDAEKNKLEFLTAKVALLSNQKTLEAFVEFTSKLYDNTDEEGNILDETNNEGEVVNIFLPFIKAAREDLEVQSVIEGNLTKTFNEIEKVQNKREKYQKSSYTNFDIFIKENKHLNKYKDNEGWYNSRIKLIKDIHTYIINNCGDMEGSPNYSNRQINFGAMYPNGKRKSFCIVEVHIKSHIRLLYQLDSKLNFKKPTPDELGAQRQSERYGVLEIKNLDDFNKISNLVMRSYDIIKKGEPLYTDHKKEA